MAFIAPYLTDAERKKAEQGAPNTTGAASGVITTPGGGAGGATPNAPAAAPTSGAGWTNLQQYLSGNPDAGGKMATATTAGLTKDASALDTGIKKAVTTGTTDINNAKQADTTAGTRLMDGIKNDASATLPAAQEYLGAGYSAKAAADYTAPLAATASSLVPKLRDVDKAENVAGALKTTYGQKGNYTSGFGALDQFLIGGSQAGRDTLATVKAKGDTLNSALGNAKSQLEVAEIGAKNQHAKNRALVKGAAGTQKTASVGDATTRLAAQNAGIDRTRANFKEASLGDVLTDDQRLDIAALNAIAGITDNTDYVTQTYNAGDDKLLIEDGEVVARAGSGGNGGLNPQLEKVAGAAAKAGKDIADTVKNAPEDIADSLKDIGGQASRLAKEALTGITNKVPIKPSPIIAPSLLPLIGAAPKKIADEVRKVDPYDMGIGSVADTASSAWNGLGDYLSDTGQKASDYVTARIPKPLRW